MEKYIMNRKLIAALLVILNASMICSQPLPRETNSDNSVITITDVFSKTGLTIAALSTTSYAALWAGIICNDSFKEAMRDKIIPCTNIFLGFVLIGLMIENKKLTKYKLAQESSEQE